MVCQMRKYQARQLGLLLGCGGSDRGRGGGCGPYPKLHNEPVDPGFVDSAQPGGANQQRLKYGMRTFSGGW